MKNTTDLASYYNAETRFRKALNRFREILISTELKEEFNREMPVYTLNGKNLIGLGVLKDQLVVLFFNGNLLRDKNNLLINAQEEKTEYVRKLCYTNLEEIDENIVKTYIQEAITIQKEGITTENSSVIQGVIIPKELQNAFALSSHLKTRFALLPEEKQQEYSDYIGQGEDEQARSKRLEHCIPSIMLLRGMDRELL